MRRTTLLLALLLSAAPAAAADVHGYNDGDEGVVDVLYDGLHATCGYRAYWSPNRQGPILVVAGHAVATPDATREPVVTRLRCVLRWERATNVDDEYVREGGTVVFGPAVDAPSWGGAFEICASAGVLWSDDTSTGSTDLACVPARFPPGSVEPEVAP